MKENSGVVPKLRALACLSITAAGSLGRLGTSRNGLFVTNRRFVGRMCSVFGAVLYFLLLSANIFAESCNDLASQAFPHAEIRMSQLVTGGKFAPPFGEIIGDLPAFCRVVATLHPSSDSNVLVEIWMPVTEWNGRMEGTGNGGFAGQIAYSALAGGVKNGYAVANTDMGMSLPKGADVSTFVNHPERWTDWGSRSTHEMTVFAKYLIKAYYGHEPHKAYFVGCSTGGEQALSEAQKFPEDYDGVVGGAAANNRTGVHLSILWNFAAMQRTPESYIPQKKRDTIHSAILAACGNAREREQGFLDNPAQCNFDPASLQCTEKDNDQCLTDAQLQTARLLYSGPVDSRTQQALYPGLPYGSEYAWTKFDPNPAAKNPPYFAIFQWALGPQTNWRDVNFGPQAEAYQSRLEGYLNATSPDLDRFRNYGHKLLVYHGWADALVPPGEAIRYYDSVTTRYSRDQSKGADVEVGKFYRLFMIPGMEHCGGGAGVGSFDPLSTVVKWVEHGTPPEAITASKKTSDGKVIHRLLCPYPRVAAYRGSGDVNEAQSYTCVSASASERTEK